MSSVQAVGAAAAPWSGLLVPGLSYRNVVLEFNSCSAVLLATPGDRGLLLTCPYNLICLFTLP